jgi:hypothetical protein
MLRDLDRIATASEAELYRLRDYLAANLLRPEPGLGRRQKVRAAELIAGVLSRTRPPGSLVEVIPTTVDPISAVNQFMAFHTWPTDGRGSRKSGASDGAYGFHQMLTALAEYPQLLRRLGLVIDLELTADAAFPLSSRGRLKQLRAVPSFGTALVSGTLIYSPATNYLFYPRPQPPEVPLPMFSAAPLSAGDNLLDAELSCGLLNLQRGRRAPQSDPAYDPVYDVMQLDVDGAMLKAVTTISGIVAGEGHGAPPIDDSTESGAPSLRTSGLSITWKGHAGTLSQGLQRAAQHESDLARGVTTQMFAEDLIRGYRIDIRTAPPAPDHPGPGAASPWRSLHQRLGTYTVGKSGGDAIVLPDIADEGFVQPGFAQKPAAITAPPAAPPPILVQDSLFCWHAWSLSVPRPSNPVNTAPGEDDAGTTGQTGAGGLQLRCDFQVPANSLPRLRFGWYYQLRARAVDLAGNSLTLEQADQVIAAFQSGISPPILFPNIGEFSYRRYEAMHAPELVLRQDLTEGETFETLVIRSNVGMSAKDYAARYPKYQAVNERHVAPAKISQLMAELHGVLDGSFGSTGDFATYYNICKKEKGTFDDPAVLDTRTGSYVPISYTGQLSFGSRSRAAGPDRYPIHGERHLKLPYLPDPVINGAALFAVLPSVLGQQGSIDPASRKLKYTGSDLPGSAAAWLGYVTKIDYGPAQSWPDLLPFRLQLAEPPNDDDSPQAQVPPQPVWDDQERVLTVFRLLARRGAHQRRGRPSRADGGGLGRRTRMGNDQPIAAAGARSGSADAARIVGRTRFGSRFTAVREVPTCGA